MGATRVRTASLLLAAALAFAGAVPVAAQDVEAGDALMASLLQAEDLAPGFDTLGPEEGSPFDIDSGAFSRHGGRRVVSQAWSSETNGVVLDFRMELPSAEAAADYLTEAEPILSEADVTGLALESDDEPVGEDARHYAGVTRIDAERAITFDGYLFRVGPVAAKVFVASVDLPDGEARRLAEVAAERMAVFASPEVAPGTFEGPVPASSARPAPSATVASPSPWPAPVGRLAALVPAAVAPTCRAFETSMEGAVEALSCRLGDDLVVYAAFADAVALTEAFMLATADLDPGARTGSCARGPMSDAAGTGNEPLGEFACWEPPGGGLVLFWTDEADLVLGAIRTESDDRAGLAATWQAAQLP